MRIQQRLTQMLFVFALLLGLCGLTARATQDTSAELACTGLCNSSSYVSGESSVVLKSLGGVDAWADFQVIVPDTHYVGIESEWYSVSYINWSLNPEDDGFGYLEGIDNNTDDSARFSERARSASNMTCHYVLHADVEGEPEQDSGAQETHSMDIYVKFVDVLVTFSKSELRPGIGESRSEQVTVLVNRATSEDVTINLTITSVCSSGAANVSPESFVSTSSNPNRVVTVVGETESATNQDIHLNATNDMDTETVVSIPVTVTLPHSWSNDAIGTKTPGATPTITPLQGLGQGLNQVAFYEDVIFTIYDLFSVPLGPAWAGTPVNESMKMNPNPSVPWPGWGPMDYNGGTTVLDGQGRVPDHCRAIPEPGVFTDAQIAAWATHPYNNPGSSVYLKHCVGDDEVSPNDFRTEPVVNGVWQITDAFSDVP